MLKNRLLYGAALLGALLFHCFYAGWISWLLLTLALTLPVLSLLCAMPWMLHAKLTVELPQSCKRGEAATLRLFNAHRRGLPSPPCTFRVQRQDRLGGTITRQTYSLCAWEEKAIALDTAHCGADTYTLSHGRMMDYLGLFSVRMRLPEAGTLHILPHEAPPKPMPNLSRFQARSYRAKYGGGFSEIHDLRDYRPGDSMRDVHWKLSAKTDSLVVREAQEPNRGQTILTLDLRGTRAELDQTLDILCWMSRWLIAHETAHFVCWLRPSDCEAMTEAVSGEAELQLLLKTLLESTLQPGTPSIRNCGFAAADWRYHIQPPEEGTE